MYCFKYQINFSQSLYTRRVPWSDLKHKTRIALFPVTVQMGVESEFASWVGCENQTFEKWKFQKYAKIKHSGKKTKEKL